MTIAVLLRSGVTGNCHAPFWRAVEGATSSLTLIFQASINIKNKAINHYGLNVAKKSSKKVRRDLPEPKQLSLFQTPTSELTETKGRKHYARKSKRDVPGNLSEYTLQLSLFNQENNHPDRDSL